MHGTRNVPLRRAKLHGTLLGRRCEIAALTHGALPSMLVIFEILTVILIRYDRNNVTKLMPHR